MKKLITFLILIAFASASYGQLLAPKGIKIGNYTKVGTGVITVDSIVQLSTNQFQLYKGGTLLNAVNVLKVNIADTSNMLTRYARKLSPTFTGTVTIPTPFTIGAVSVTATGTHLNYINTLRSNVQTQLDDTINGATVFVKLVPDTAHYTNAFTLQASDANRWIGVNKATFVDITLPPDASVTIPVGTTINFVQEGAGIMVFKAGAGVTLYSFKDSIASDGINSWVGVYKWATNKYRIYGNIGQ